MAAVLGHRVLSASLFSATLIATPALSQSSTIWDCENGSMRRHIELNEEMTAPPVCDVWYDKSEEGGLKTRLWSADHEGEYCRVKASAFVEKLQGWGWHCTIRRALKENTSESPF